jgi:hypothetical protein
MMQTLIKTYVTTGIIFAGGYYTYKLFFDKRKFISIAFNKN